MSLSRLQKTKLFETKSRNYDDHIDERILNGRDSPSDQIFSEVTRDLLPGSSTHSCSFTLTPVRPR